MQKYSCARYECINNADVLDVIHQGLSLSYLQL